jgi:GNAT superfamily N-acetyltransferase
MWSSRTDPVVPDVRVRRARCDEVDALSNLAFRSKAHWGYDDALMELWREELRVQPSDLDGGRVLVASIDGEVVGFATVTGEAPDAELEAMFVEPTSIRTGSGTILFAAACELARELGCTRLLIESEPNAEGFYERHGATRIGHRESVSVPGRHLPLLVLTL